LTGEIPKLVVVLEEIMLVQIVLFDTFDMLDVVAPYEVMYSGAMASGGQVKVELVSLEGARRVVSGVHGAAMEATGPIDLDRADLLIIPGSLGPIAEIPALAAKISQSELMTVFQEAIARPDVTVAAICGGSIILAMAGLLEGRNAISHHGGLDVLRACGVNVMKARVVDDGDLITCGAVTSGLELSLYMLERELGPRVALEVEHILDYERRGVVWRNQGIAPEAISDALTNAAVPA
jgi:transcriptional regulator GlxA family with amidase domain